MWSERALVGSPMAGVFLIVGQGRGRGVAGMGRRAHCGVQLMYVEGVVGEWKSR